jgi:hypothetical protein
MGTYVVLGKTASKVSVARMPSPEGAGGSGPTELHPYRSEFSVSDVWQVTVRPVLPRNGPGSALTNCMNRRSNMISNSKAPTSRVLFSSTTSSVNGPGAGTYLTGGSSLMSAVDVPGVLVAVAAPSGVCVGVAVAVRVGVAVGMGCFVIVAPVQVTAPSPRLAQPSA